MEKKVSQSSFPERVSSGRLTHEDVWLFNAIALVAAALAVYLLLTPGVPFMATPNKSGAATPQGPYATLEVTSTPPGALIAINGRKQARQTPARFVIPMDKARTITIGATLNQAGAQKEVVLTPGKTSKIALTLK